MCDATCLQPYYTCNSISRKGKRVCGSHSGVERSRKDQTAAELPGTIMEEKSVRILRKDMLKDI
jgi:hypothetical protein